MNVNGFIPHKEDLNTDAKLPGMITEDMIAIEANDADNREAFNKEIQDRKDAYNNLQNQVDKLDTEKATNDDLEDLRDEMHQIRDNWHDRASHIAMGTDIETTKSVVEQILQEKGLI